MLLLYRGAYDDYQQVQSLLTEIILDWLKYNDGLLTPLVLLLVRLMIYKMTAVHNELFHERPTSLVDSSALTRDKVSRLSFLPYIYYTGYLAISAMLVKRSTLIAADYRGMLFQIVLLTSKLNFQTSTLLSNSWERVKCPGTIAGCIFRSIYMFRRH